MALLFYTIYGLALFFFCGWCFVWLMHLMAIVNAKLKLHRKSSGPPPSLEVPLPGVSILKPLVGVDPNLFTNLETFFTLNYPQYEILFCIQDESDPSLMLIKKLTEKHPKVDIQIFIGGSKVGINPKINNMQPGYQAAKYELILVSDSGLRMKEDTLFDLVSVMGDNVGTVFQLPFTCDRQGFPATFEKVFFGTVHARISLSADICGINCTTGMSMLMRKKLLDDIGGIKAFGHYLAEDYFFAKSFQERGWKVRIAPQPAWQNSGVCDIAVFQERLMRWTKLRIPMVPHTMILEPLSECMVLGALVAWATHFMFQWDPMVLFLVHVLIWFILDWILLCIMQNGSHPCSKWDFVVAWMIRECCATYLFFKAIWDPHIRWRTGTYRIRWGGVAEEVHLKS